MKARVVFTLVLLLLGGLITQAWSAEGSDEPKVLKFQTMFGVSGPFLGNANPVQGVPGAGAAWTNPKVQGELRANGELKIRVRGLVLVSTGVNPVATFRGIVSCRSINTSTTPASANTVIVTTGVFPATPTGDATIEQTLVLPTPCVAPIVFVGPGAGDPRWFAATGLATPLD